MNDRSTQRELTKFFIIIFFFAAALAALKVYDLRTNQIQRLGSTIFSRFLGK